MALRPVALVPVVAVAALWMTAPGPLTACTVLRTAAQATDPFAPLIALAALLAWSLAGWLLVVFLATWASRVPGLLGRHADAVARRIAPFAVRRVAALALGVTVATGGLGASAAVPAAGDAPAIPAPPAAALDWPTRPASHALDWGPGAVPVGARPATALPAAAQTRGAKHEVVVRPGDSLWRVAARGLGDAATTTRIAVAWPAWWAANRDAIGPDPDLIHPGLRLSPPTTP